MVFIKKCSFCFLFMLLSSIVFCQLSVEGLTLVHNTQDSRSTFIKRGKKIELTYQNKHQTEFITGYLMGVETKSILLQLNKMDELTTNPPLDFSNVLENIQKIPIASIRTIKRKKGVGSQVLNGLGYLLMTSGTLILLSQVNGGGCGYECDFVPAIRTFGVTTVVVGAVITISTKSKKYKINKENWAIF